MKSFRKLTSLLLCLAMLAALAACGSEQTAATATVEEAASVTAEEAPDASVFVVDYSDIAVGTVNARASVHDPSIVEADGKYYIFGSHMTAAVSDNLRSWTSICNGYSEDNPVYAFIYDEESGALDYTGSPDSVIPNSGISVWAPDVIYNEAQGLWTMYYCTSSTFNGSTLCYATSESVEGPYVWQANLLYSGLTSETLPYTDVYDYVDEETALATYVDAKDEYDYNNYPNCIDPTVFYDADGRMWMVYGSFSGGIFILEIDEQTGLVIHPETDTENGVDAYFGKKLLGGNHQSMEGPYILWDEEAGYYYLYVSYGDLAKDYQIRCFRSENPDGPYVDMNGVAPNGKGNANYTGLKLSGNYELPSVRLAYRATGHNSALISTDGKRYIAYHTRFVGNDNHSPRVKQYFLNEEGWPCMLPYATDGETISETGYDISELAGRYYVVNQGITRDENVAEPFILVLTELGNVFGENITGTWTVTDGTCYVHLTYDGTEYSGVFCRMNDEAGTEVMTFTAVGNNASVWGVCYGD